MGDLLDMVDDIKYALRDLFKNPNFKRWAIELAISLVIGITAGCISYNVLNKSDKSLKVADVNAVAIADEDVASSGSDGQTDADSDTSTEDDYSDVVITVKEQVSYPSAVSDWSSEEIEAAISERQAYLDGNKYWSAVSSYWETARNVTDNSRYSSYLFDTANKVYSAEDFSGVPAEVIHVAKNEIYARHGYSFKDKDIYNYFMGQIWYTPSVMPADFSEKTFSETEVKNLDLLNSLDTL